MKYVNLFLNRYLSGYYDGATDEVSNDEVQRAVLLNRRSMTEKVQASYKFVMKVAVSELKRRYEGNFSTLKNVTMNDLHMRLVVGEGGFGKVVATECPRFYEGLAAIKIMKKRGFFENNIVDNEVRIHSVLKSPFITNLMFTFQSTTYDFLVLELADRGDFASYLKASSGLPEATTKFCITQILLALEYMHGGEIIYRDLKPGNLLIAHDGYLKITDFGVAKKLSGRTYTFCGTVTSMAPELVKSKPYNHSVDIWAVGILIYMLLFRKAPFRHPEMYGILEMILHDDIRIPEGFDVSEPCLDIMNQLLEKNVTFRLGMLRGGYDDIRKHPWFSDIKWETMFRKLYPSPIKHDFSVKEQLTSESVLTWEDLYPGEPANSFFGF